MGRPFYFHVLKQAIPASGEEQFYCSTNIDSCSFSPEPGFTQMNGSITRFKGLTYLLLCKISLRGYEAAVLLQAHGYTNVKVLEGGLVAWPFEKEK